MAGKKRAGFSNPVKNRDLESCPNIVFPLDFCSAQKLSILLEHNRRNKSDVFDSSQKMALRTFHLINVHKSCGHIVT